MSWVSQNLSSEQIEAAFQVLRAEAPHYITDYADGNEHFALYLRIVDGWLYREAGVTHRDLSDWTWRIAFDEGVRPKHAAEEALENDDTYSMVVSGGRFE